VSERPPQVALVERIWQSHGYDCVAIQHPMGHRCGYVVVQEGHPWWGLHARDASPVVFPDDAVDSLNDIDVLALLHAALFDDEEDYTQSVSAQVRVHGGLTWSAPVTELEFFVSLEELPLGWWMGFDCSHAGDEYPADSYMGRLMRPIREKLGHELMRGHVWLTEEVVEETERLAEQVAAAQYLWEAQGSARAQHRGDSP